MARQHIACHERALACWQERVAEQQAAAAVDSREAWLTEHGETTLALLHVESERRAWELDELRDELAARARERPANELADRDACVRANLAVLQPEDVPPPAPELNVDLDLGP